MNNLYGGGGDRLQQLIEAMKRGRPGSPLMGTPGGPGMGRISGRPSMGGNAIRGGFMNRRTGLAPLGFSPYAAQMAQGHKSLQAPENPGMDEGVASPRGYAGQAQAQSAQNSQVTPPGLVAPPPPVQDGADPLSGNSFVGPDPFAGLANLSPADLLRLIQPTRNPWGAYSRHAGEF